VLLKIRSWPRPVGVPTSRVKVVMRVLRLTPWELPEGLATELGWGEDSEELTKRHGEVGG
jgi:hypothetical protein